MSIFTYMAGHLQDISFRGLQHLQITLLSVLIAIAVGVPLGILVSYVKPFKKPVLGFANLVQAIPSIALLGFLVPFLGIGEKPAIFMVVIYSLLPIVKNTATGLANINRDTLEAAKGIGMTRLQILMKVKLPLSLPVIMAGIRISAVTAVGLVTLAAFIGAGGLGYLIYSGIRTNNQNLVLSGAIPACLLALLIDWLGSVVERLTTPACFKANKNNNNGRNKSMKKRIICLFIALAALVMLMSGCSGENKTVVVGGKDFTEQDILGNMLTLMFENNTNLKVEYKHEMASNVVFAAIQSGDIDVYIDYTGTIYGNYLSYSEIKSADEVREIAVKEMAEKFQLQVLDPLGFNNTYTLAVRPETASEYNLKTYSDLAAVSSGLALGGTFEILNRNDGIPNLKIVYDMAFKDEVALDGTLRYSAIASDEVQIIDAFSTDGMLLEFDLVVLEDDKSFFPPYHAVPVLREDTAEKYPEIARELKKLSNFISDDTMRELNYKVDVLKENPKDVAESFLKNSGLIE